MRYYMIEQERKDMSIPTLKNWFRRLTEGHERAPDVDSLVDRELFVVDAKDNAIYPSIILFPFVMLSEELKKCLSLYEPNMIFKEIVLLDQKRRDVHVYFHPVLKNVDCLSEKSEYGFGHVELIKIDLEEEKIPDKVFFRIDGPEKDYYIIRLDALESFIRRGMNGIKIKEVSVSQSMK